MKFFCALAVLVSACGAALSQQAKGPDVRFLGGIGSVSLPVRSSNNLVLVDARVNGSEPGTFIFDTGAESTVIDAGFARSLGLKRSGTTVGTGSAGTATAGVIRNVTVKLGDVEASGLTVYSLDLSGFAPGLGVKPAGIIGNDIIAKVVVAIDYAAARLTLYSPGTFPVPPDADVIEATMSGNLPFIKSRIVPNGRPPLDAKCELDTGSTGTVLLNSPFVIRHRLVATLGRSMIARSGGVGGTGQSRVGRITSIDLGRTVIRDPIAILFQGTRGDNASNKYDCLIGGAIFRRFRIAFDMSGGKVYLEPNASVSEPFETDMSGMDLLGDGDDLTKILIDEVHLNSAAARAGVKGGDILVAIDGKKTVDLGLQEVRRLLRIDGAQYELTLLRGKRELKVTITLKRVI